MGAETNRSVKSLNPNEQKSQNFSSASKNGLENGHYSDQPTCAYVYHRVFGYSVGAAVHLGNILAMMIALRGPIMKDPDVKHFYSMGFLYFTIWNLFFQLLYIGMGFACDLPILLEMNNSKFLNWLRVYRKTFYSAALWPCGMVVFSIFWPLFYYDRNLLYPGYIDKALSPVSNFVMHIFILFPIASDLFFLPNQKPRSQINTIAHYETIFITYIVIVFGYYSQTGKWPYPILHLTYGTVYFPLFIIMTAIWKIILYLLQWPLMSIIWRNKSKLF